MTYTYTNFMPDVNAWDAWDDELDVMPPRVKLDHVYLFQRMLDERALDKTLASLKAFVMKDKPAELESELLFLVHPNGLSATRLEKLLVACEALLLTYEEE